MSDVSQPTIVDSAPTRAEVCAVAIAEAFRGDGERLCNPIGTIPMVGGRLARESFEPDLVMTDGFGAFAANAMSPGAPIGDAVVEAWNPYPQMFQVLWNGKRHVMMGATQLDRYGNQNIACIGDWHHPFPAPRIQRSAGQHHQPHHQLLGAEPLDQGLRTGGRRGLWRGI